MIVINSKTHYTIADAAKEFGVASKTVHDWIGKGIIPRPPVVPYGIRRIQTFPSDYMKVARRELRKYLNKKSARDHARSNHN